MGAAPGPPPPTGPDEPIRVNVTEIDWESAGEKFERGRQRARAYDAEQEARTRWATKLAASDAEAHAQIARDSSDAQAKPFLPASFDLPDWMRTTLSTIIQFVLNLGEAPNIGGAVSDPALAARLHAELGKAILDNIRPQMPSAAVPFEQIGEANLLRLAENTMRSLLSSWVLGILAEVVSVGQVENVIKWMDNFPQATGMGRIWRQALRADTEILVATPRERQLSKQFRHQHFSPRDAVRAFLAGFLDLDRAREDLREAGWAEERINFFFATLREQLSPAAAAQAADGGLIDDADYRGILARAGFDRFDADLLRRLNRRKPGASQLVRMVELNILDINQAEKILTEDGWTPEFARALLELERQDRIASFRSRIVDQALSAWGEREITESEFIRFLGAGGLTVEEIDHARVLGDLLRSRPRKLSFGQLSEAFTDRLVDIAFVQQWLEQEGYTERDAIVLEELLLRRKLTDEERERRRQERLEQQRTPNRN